MENKLSSAQKEAAQVAVNLEGNEKTRLFTKREWILRYSSPFFALLFMAGPMILIVLSNALYGIIDKELTLNYAISQISDIKTNGIGMFNGQGVYMHFYQVVNGQWTEVAADSDLTGLSDFAKQLINVSTQFSGTVIALLSALSMLTSVGTSIRFGQLMGARDKEKMDNALVTGFIQTVILSGLTVLIFYFVNPYIITAQAGVSYADRNESLQFMLTHDFTTTYVFGFPLLAISTFLVTMLRSEGKVWWVIGIQLTSVVINVILGIVFMEKLDLGMKGAVYGSMVAWSFSIIASLLIIGLSKNTLLVPNIKKYRMKKTDVATVWMYGISVFLMNFAFAVISFVSTILINNLHTASQYGKIDGTLGVMIGGKEMGVINGQLPINSQVPDPEYISVSLRVLSSTQPWLQILYAPVSGIVQGGATIIAYNFGAQKHKRIKKVYQMMVIISVSWAALALAIMCGTREYLMAAFDGPKGKGWWFVFNYISFPFIGLGFNTMVLANGTRNNHFAALWSATRSFIFEILTMVVGFFIAKAVSADGSKDWIFFLCYGTTEMFAGIVAGIFLFLMNRKFKKNNMTEDAPDTFTVPSYFDAIENEINIAVDRDQKLIDFREGMQIKAKNNADGHLTKEIKAFNILRKNEIELKGSIKKIDVAVTFEKRAHRKYKTSWTDDQVIKKQLEVKKELSQQYSDLKSEIANSKKALSA
jgi:Na+-driven multidrug efflux pump